jgi:hypothetical protein
MNSKNRVIRILSVLLFSVGVLLGIALFGLTVWADFEASMFDVTMRGTASLKTLACPVLMTATETGTVRATFTNPFERPVEFRIRAHISDGYVTLMREINSNLSLAPGETKPLEWPVTPDDAAYGRLILVRVRVGAKYPLPSRHASCGILVVGLPYFTGNLVLGIAFATSLLSMVAGTGLWILANRPLRGLGRDATWAMGALAGCVVAGTVVGLLGWWVVGVIILVITVLLTGAIIGYFVNRGQVVRSSVVG